MKTAIFKSTYGADKEGYPGYPERSGQTVEVLRPLTAAERDEEVGDMYRIRFADGAETDAFADELTHAVAALPAQGVWSDAIALATGGAA